MKALENSQTRGRVSIGGSVAVTTEPENPIPDEGPGEQPDQGEGKYWGVGCSDNRDGEPRP